MHPPTHVGALGNKGLRLQIQSALVPKFVFMSPPRQRGGVAVTSNILRIALATDAPPNSRWGLLKTAFGGKKNRFNYFEHLFKSPQRELGGARATDAPPNSRWGLLKTNTNGLQTTKKAACLQHTAFENNVYNCVNGGLQAKSWRRIRRCHPTPLQCAEAGCTWRCDRYGWLIQS